MGICQYCGEESDIADIPYSLLAFYPNFYINDLPTTSRAHALRCQAVAEDAGLNRIHIGNLHLLGEDY